MAEKSKRATTSEPRTRGQKTTSKSSKEVAKPKATAKKATASAKKSSTTQSSAVMTESSEAPLMADAPEAVDAPISAESPEAPVTAEAPAIPDATAKPAKAATKATKATKKKASATSEAKPAAKKAKKAAAPSPEATPAEAASSDEPAAEAPAAAPVEPPSATPPSPAAAEEQPTAARASTTKRATKKKPAKKKLSKASTASRAPSLPLKQYEFIGVPSLKGQPPEERPALLAPPPPPPKQLTLEERLEILQTRLARQSEGVRAQIQEQLDMSWIYHDSALEGVVYSFQELKTALGPDQTLVQESNLQPVVDEIRRHRAAIELVRECAKKKTPITLDLVKRIYLTLHPEEGDIKTVKYRKDIPQHRLYFHEYAAPDKIAGKVRQVIDWLNEPETQKGRNALRVAARAHYDLLRAFPFQTDSGKVARLLMNLLLLQSGYEPAIIHSTERQRYYDALKGSAPVIISMVVEAEENAVMSLEKLLDDLELRGRGYAG